MKMLQDYSQQVWMLTTLKDKKLVAHEMINEMTFQKKADELHAKLDKITSCTKVDELVANITLTGSSLKVMR